MIKTVTKLILNSPFGRFGMNINKPIHEIVEKDKLDYILSTHEVHSLKELNNNMFIVSYNSEISKSVCETSGLDYIKVLESQKKDSENNVKVEDVSITTAASITAYARIYINRIKL
jgi:Pyruvate/2-oxoacid:ferredoxin oxidoreductase gamma subunit